MRIALIRPDRIGDCVIGSVAINDLRLALPGAEIFLGRAQTDGGAFRGQGFPGETRRL